MSPDRPRHQLGWWALSAATILGACADGTRPETQPPEFVAILSDWHTGPAVWASARCFGAVIEPDLVATAAHCAQGRDATSLRITAGVEDLCAVSDTAAFSQGESWERPDPGGADLVLLRLADPLPVEPVPVYVGPVRTGTRLELLSWGPDRPGGPAPCTPKRAVLRSIDGGRCAAALRPADRRPSRLAGPGELCAAPFPGQTGACPGDSGAPLVDSANQLVAITSRWVGCDETSPGIYARLPADIAKGTTP